MDQSANDPQQGGQNSASGNVETMLDFNALQYEMFPDLSVCTERTMKNAYFQRDSYDSNTTAYCVLNTGSDFIDGRNSYLMFDLELVGNISDYEVATFGKSGSAYNLIRRIILTDRAGNELERIENVNRLVALNQHHCNSLEWFNTYASQFNFPAEMYTARNVEDESISVNDESIEFTSNDISAGTCTITTTNEANTVFPGDYFSIIREHDPLKRKGHVVLYEGFCISRNATTIVAYPPCDQSVLGKTIDSKIIQNTKLYDNKSLSPFGKTWLLPLRWMSGIFDYDQLLPSQLMSGLRIEIQFETATKAFMRLNTGVTPNTIGYTIKNPRIVLDSCKLTDAIQRELNERSANDGLEIVYRTWWSTESVANSTTINLESRKAVSRAFRALTCIYDKDNIESNSMVPSKFDFSRFQYRAGNLYFPNQPVTSSGVYGTHIPDRDVLIEAFNHAQKLFSKNKEIWWPNSQSVAGWEHLAEPNYLRTERSDANRAFAVIVADLERTTVQDLSGIPLNNSRVLALQASLKNSPTDQPIIMFMQYLKIARIFLDNTEVEE